MQIEAIIEGVKKKIVLADHKDREQISKTLSAIFQEGLDSYFKVLDFDGVNLIKMLEKNEKIIQNKVHQAKDYFEKFKQEVLTLANSRMKQIFSL